MTYEDFRNLVFEKDVEAKTIKAFDINYVCWIGTFKFEEGPGWVLNLETNFLDVGQMSTLVAYISKIYRDPWSKP